MIPTNLNHDNEVFISLSGQDGGNLDPLGSPVRRTVTGFDPDGSHTHTTTHTTTCCQSWNPERHLAYTFRIQNLSDSDSGVVLPYVER